MATASPPPSTDSTTTTTPLSPSQQIPIILSFSLLVLCPLVLALPPRRLNPQAAVLVAGTTVGGYGVWGEVQRRGAAARRQGTGRGTTTASAAPTQAITRYPGLPEKAWAVKERLELEKEARRRRETGEEGAGSIQTAGSSPLSSSATPSSPSHTGQGLLQRIWMGGEEADWKARRDQREREALEQGKGYGDLIYEQIWEVWNWGAKDGGKKEAGKRNGEDGNEGMTNESSKSS